LWFFIAGTHSGCGSDGLTKDFAGFSCEVIGKIKADKYNLIFITHAEKERSSGSGVCIARAAPVPSPNLIPRSNIGESPRWSSII